MNDAPIWIEETDAASLIDLNEAIDVLADVHRLYATGEATNMVKTHAQSDAANLHAVGAVITGLSIAGTKTWIHTPGGAQPLLILFSPLDGQVRAIIEAFALGQRRTAATSGLATRLLSRADSATLGLIGTGKQALAQAEAVVAVRPRVAAVSVYGRDAERRRACVERLQGALEVYVREEPDLAKLLRSVDVLSTVTRAAEPFIDGEHLPAGIHINGVGAILPTRREVHTSVIERCDAIITDSLPQAQSDSGELRTAESEGVISWADVTELGQLVDHPAGGRRSDSDITFFKAMGVGIADVALGAEVLRRARDLGLGRPLKAAEARSR